MSSLVLHSFRRCPFAIRVRMVLEEKGLKYTVHEEDLDSPSPELLLLNPSGQVPVLVNGLKSLTESPIITEYLEMTYPEIRLTPDTGIQSTHQWTQWCDSVFKPDLDNWKYNFDSMDSLAQTELISRLKSHLFKLESALSESSDFLEGSAFTLTDIHVFPFFRQLRKARRDYDSRFKTPRTDAWLERILERPSFKRAMARTLDKKEDETCR